MIDERALKAAIKDELAELEALSASVAASDARGTVELDQQAQGRLSRQDALRSQAMAQAAEQRRVRRRLALRAALDRMDEGEYGYCPACGEAIAAGRLKIDPAVVACVSCSRGSADPPRR